MSIGPDWGDAHIDVHADTRRLKAELRAAAATAGKEFGKDWGDAADTSMGQELTVLGRHIETALSKRMGPGGKEAGKQWTEGFADALEDGVRRRLRNFQSDIVEAALSGDWSSVVARFENLDEAVAGVRRQFQDLKDSETLSKEALQDLHGSFDAWTTAVHRDNAFAVMFEDARKMHVEFEKNAAEFDRLRLEADRLNKAFDTEEIHKYNAELAVQRNEARSTHTEITKLLRAHQDEDRALQNTVDAAHLVALNFNHLRGEMNKTGTEFSLLGRLAGNRNNFINIIGAVARGVEGTFSKLVDTMADLPAKFTHFAQTVESNGGGLQGFFKTAQQGFAGLQESASALGKGGPIAIAVVGILALASGLALVGGIAATVAIAVDGLTGAVIALGGSLSFAVLGALAPIVPVLAALAAGVGAVLIAFNDTGEQLDKVKAPFKEFYDAIKKPVEEALFKNLATDAAAFKDVLNNFVGPLLIDSANALSSAITYLVEAFARPEVQATLGLLAQVLPPILENFGKALVDAAIGFLGFVTQAAPSALALSQSVADIAKQFADWANNKDGTNSLSTTLGDASVSAQILWDLVLAVGNAVGTLFTQGKDTGDGFLQKLVDIVNEFDTWANSPEGREKIASWLELATQLGGELATTIERVGHFIERLDSPENREAVLSMIDLLNDMLGTFENISAAGARVFQTFIASMRFSQQVWNDVAGALTSGLQAILRFFDRLIEAVKSFKGWLDKLKAPSWLNNFQDNVSGFFDRFLPKTASGGLFNGAQARVIGEAGPEAVVPLDRPLALVDPSVRWMSALLQGKGNRNTASGGLFGGGNGVYIAPGAINLQTSVDDPATLVNMLLDRLVAKAV